MADGDGTGFSVTLVSDREIVMTRLFNAPRRLVFEACTRAEHMRRWWAPACVTMVVCEMDVRPGGTYRIITRGLDGSEYPFTGVYREVVPPERLVYTQRFDVEPFSRDEAIITMTLEEHHGRTMMRSSILHATPEARAAHVQSGMEVGAAEAYDQLEELLASMAGAWPVASQDAELRGR
ncbi:MAG TPA: SRPBCC family protein [Candidatus Kapabacteria bacterium]|nr:SRPBCC family protein [Candidatus Kapabacteria bacterium]